MLLDPIFRFFLAFSHETILLPLIIIGYIWLDRTTFFHGICLLLISMLLNLALKCSFKIPLSPTLGKEGFAFPSGHMQTCIVFYSWLFKSTSILAIRIAIILLLICVALGLIHFGYHNYFDLLGAAFFGLLLILAYTLFLKTFKNKLLPTVIGLFIFSTLLLIYIGFVYEIGEYSWMAYYALVGILGAEYCFKSKGIAVNYKQKLIATVFFIIVFILANKIFINLPLAKNLAQLKWLFLGYAIPLALYFAATVKPTSYKSADK